MFRGLRRLSRRSLNRSLSLHPISHYLLFPLPLFFERTLLSLVLIVHILERDTLGRLCRSSFGRLDLLALLLLLYSLLLFETLLLFALLLLVDSLLLFQLLLFFSLLFLQLGLFFHLLPIELALLARWGCNLIVRPIALFWFAIAS